jgi:transposase-like protein
VHFYRNVFSHVPSTRVREVSHMLKAIHAQESREAADNKAQAIVDDLRASKMGKAADLVEQAVLLWLPGHSLAEDPNQQPAGADHERDPA